MVQCAEPLETGPRCPEKKETEIVSLPPWPWEAAVSAAAKRTSSAASATASCRASDLDAGSVAPGEQAMAAPCMATTNQMAPRFISTSRRARARSPND